METNVQSQCHCQCCKGKGYCPYHCQCTCSCCSCPPSNSVDKFIFDTENKNYFALE
eukprot:Pgem_evm1s18215